MSKKILFWIDSKNPKDTDVNPPSPAKKEIPKYYSEMSRYHKGTKLTVDEGAANLSVKACIPFYDALTAGYIVKLHCDIFIDLEEESIKWTSDTPPVVGRAQGMFDKIPAVPGYKSFKLGFTVFYPCFLPKGYSALITQPMNRFDLPTYIPSAIVDADISNGSGVVAFSVKEGFTGIIPAGTPIMQIIPFKRDTWTMEVPKEKPKTKVNWYPLNKISGWYKLNVWQRKEWN
jgi:hypothetical protein